MSCCFHNKYDVKNHIHILGYGGGKRLGGETTRAKWFGGETTRIHGVWHKQRFSDKTINERCFFSQDSYSGAQIINRIKDWYL